MPFSIRLFRRFPVECPVTSNARPFLKLPLTYASSFWSLIPLLSLDGIPAYAGWVAVEKSYLLLRTTDSTCRPRQHSQRSESGVDMAIVDFKWVQGKGGIGRPRLGPHRCWPTKTHEQFDCAEKRLQLLGFMKFSRHMGRGISADEYEQRRLTIRFSLERCVA